MINVNYNFTNDIRDFWNNYWKDNEILGNQKYDIDKLSKTLTEYHKTIYSKKLPNGMYLNLKNSNSGNFLLYNNIQLSNDSITTSFRYKNNLTMLYKIKEHLKDYHKFIEDYFNATSTIGGNILFPKMKQSINQSRGINYYIKDRFDLTLECIRLYYQNEYSPLYNVLLGNKDFFDLFVDFKGYVNFFYLQDLVTADYKKVIFLIPDNNFTDNPLPKTVEEYLQWIGNQIEFVNKRNKRIHDDLINIFKQNKAY